MTLHGTDSKAQGQVHLHNKHVLCCSGEKNINEKFLRMVHFLYKEWYHALTEKLFFKPWRQMNSESNLVLDQDNFGVILAVGDTCCGFY